ncbi:MAG TPA: PucR family transcriptional regulator [Marmoricola sp.]|nr:PucR family transcriptional regulator [Marmoricola sp.]
MSGATAGRAHPDADSQVSIRDLLSVPAFQLRLIAAPDRVDTPVRWAHPTELTDPRPYLSGHELVLTVGSSLRDDEDCREFVDHLLDAGASALGYGVGDVTEEIPSTLVEECRARGLPLLEVPRGVPFQSITEMLADRRAEARTARSRRVQQLVGRLLDAIAQDHNLADLQQIIDDELGGRVSFEHGVVDWEPVEESDVRPGADTLQHLGRILAVRQREEDTDQANRRLEVGRLVELVVQGRADAEVLHHPLIGAGVSVDQPVVVAAWPPAIAGLLAPLFDRCLIADLDDVTLTVSGDPDLVAKIAVETALPCGIGEPVPVAGLARAVPPALAALRLARTRGTLVTWRDLTTFDGLLEQQPAERLAPFTEKLIAPLVEHDQAHRTALVQTLRTFLDVDGSVNATARELFLHPNSLRHRLKRIHELTGADPRVFDDRVALAVGLWAWEQRRPRGRR